MIKRFFISLLRFIVVLVICTAVGAAAVYTIYDRYAIDSQVLIDEYEQIAVEKDFTATTPAPTPDVTPEPSPDVSPEPSPAA